MRTKSKMDEIVLNLYRSILESVEGIVGELSIEEREKWIELKEKKKWLSPDVHSEYCFIEQDDQMDMSEEAKSVLWRFVDFFDGLMKQEYFREHKKLKKTKDWFFLYVLHEYKQAECSRYF